MQETTHSFLTTRLTDPDCARQKTWASGETFRKRGLHRQVAFLSLAGPKTTPFVQPVAHVQQASIWARSVLCPSWRSLADAPSALAPLRRPSPSQPSRQGASRSRGILERTTPPHPAAAAERVVTQGSHADPNGRTSTRTSARRCQHHAPSPLVPPTERASTWSGSNRTPPRRCQTGAPSLSAACLPTSRGFSSTASKMPAAASASTSWRRRAKR